MESVFVRKVLPYRRIEKLSIIHQGEQKLFLNEGGTAIWELLDGRRSSDDVAYALAAGDVAPNALPAMMAKVSQFLTTLNHLGLITEVHQNGTAQQMRLSGIRPEPTACELLVTVGAITPMQRGCVTVIRPSGALSVRSKTNGAMSSKIEDRFNDLYWEKLYIQKMHLELTYRCNFRCIQCYNTTHAGAGTELTLAEWCSAFGQLAALGCYSLTFTGGEVFVRKDALDILQAACDNQFSFRISTNGSLIDETILQKLEPLRPFLQSIDVSFYGATPHIHDTIVRRVGAYQATLRAVRLLAEANMNLMAKFVTMRDNFDGIAKWKNDMHHLGVKHGVATGTLIPRTDRSTAPLAQLLTDQQYKNLLAMESVDKNRGAQFCRPGHIRGAITPDGRVSPCEWLTDFNFGNVREHSLHDIWFSEETRSFRKIFAEDSECCSCESRPACSRCPAHSYLETGHLLQCAPNPRHFAEIYKESKQFKEGGYDRDCCNVPHYPAESWQKNHRGEALLD